jgi:predicted nucleic acid-binding protein
MESFAKLHIQKRIHERKYDLVWSYVLDLENKANPYNEKRRNIQEWKSKAIHFYRPSDEIINKALIIEKSGIKKLDALHIACAIDSSCNYFITTDYDLIKKNIIEIKIINPIDFINLKNRAGGNINEI